MPTTKKNKKIKGKGVFSRPTRKKDNDQYAKWIPRLVPNLIQEIEYEYQDKDSSFNFFHYFSRDLDKEHIYENFEPLIERKITNECLMKDIIYIESAILRNDIENEEDPYNLWLEDRGGEDDYLTLSLHKDETYVDDFHPENLYFIKKYNETRFIKVFLKKLENIIEKGDQEVFNDTIEYYKEKLEGMLIH